MEVNTKRAKKKWKTLPLGREEIMELAGEGGQKIVSFNKNLVGLFDSQVVCIYDWVKETKLKVNVN